MIVLKLAQWSTFDLCNRRSIPAICSCLMIISPQSHVRRVLFFSCEKSAFFLLFFCSLTLTNTTGFLQGLQFPPLVTLDQYKYGS